MKSETEPKVGRPTKYSPEYDKQAYKLTLLLNATDKELADFFEVNQDTIYEWKKTYPEFSESIREGKLKADSEVAQKLYDKAIGAEWIEDFATKIKTIEYSDTGKKIREFEEIAVTPVRRAAPPDTPAISLWLRNRQFGKWKERTNVEHASDPENPIKIDLFETARTLAFIFAKDKREREAKLIENG